MRQDAGLGWDTWSKQAVVGQHSDSEHPMVRGTLPIWC